MKRLASLFGIVLFIGTVLLLASCTGGGQVPKEPTTADELYELIDKKMNEQSSYEVTETIDAVVFSSGIKMNLSGTSKAAYDSIGEDDYYFYSDSSLVMDVPELSRQFTLNSIKSYQDGVYYSLTEEDEVEQNIFTVMTRDEFLEYSENKINTDIDVYDSTERTFKKKDGMWIFEASGFSKKAINSLMKTIGFDEEIIGDDPIDIEIMFEANEDFLVDVVSMSFVFEEKAKDTPSFSIVNEYYNFGSVDRVVLNNDGLTEMDVRVLDEIEEKLSEIKNSEDGSFISNNSVTISIPNNQQTTSEQTTVSFGEGRNGYYYTIETTINGNDYKIEYENGIQTLTTEEGASQSAATESDAKAMISYYIDPASYNKYYVSSIEEKPNGITYILTISHIDASKYKEKYYTPLGAVFTGATEKLTVTIENGKITEMRFVSNAKGHLANNSSYYINVTSSFSIFTVGDYN